MRNSTLLSLAIVLSVVAVTLSAPLGGRQGGRQRRPETRDEQKNYLSRFGHWRGRKGAVNGTVNGTDQDFKKSISAYQRYFGLRETGEADNDTVQMMSNPRCGLSDNDDETSSSRRKRYILFGSRWYSKALSYFFENLTPDLPSDVTKSDVAKAFKFWADNSPLTFSESNKSSATFRLRFASGEHGDGNPFDGPGGILAHAFFPQVGNAHFDEAEMWTHGSYSGVNLLMVACHEIGHLLGLNHSPDKSAVMYPYISSYNPNFKLSPDDINGIQAIYGKPVVGVPTAPSVQPPVTPPSTIVPGYTTTRPTTTLPTTKRTTTTSTTRRPTNRRCPYYYYWFGWC